MWKRGWPRRPPGKRGVQMSYVRQQARPAPGAHGNGGAPKAVLRRDPDVTLGTGDRLYQRAWRRYTGGSYTGPDADWEGNLAARLKVLQDLVACGHMSPAQARVEADGLLNAAGLPEEAPHVDASAAPKTWADGDVRKRVTLHRANPEPVKAPPLPPPPKRQERRDRTWVDEVKALGACAGWEKELFGNRAVNDNAIAQHGGKEHL